MTRSIDEPRDGNVSYFPGFPGADATITLRGRAEDPEDGTLMGESLVWSVLEPRREWAAVGIGNEVTFTFRAAGEHQIRLVATDSHGNSGEAIVIVVHIGMVG